MATHFSELVGGAVSDASTAVATSLSDPRTKTAPGKNHAALRSKVAHMDFTASTIAGDEEIRIATFKSSDRIHEIKISSTGSGTTATMDLGLYEPGTNHDGAVLDIDLFASAYDITAGPARVDLFTESGTMTDEDRGKQLWELYFLGAGSDTTNPAVNYDLVGTVGSTVTAFTEGEMTIEVVYTTD